MPGLPLGFPFTLGVAPVGDFALATPRVRNIFLDSQTGRFALQNGNLRMVADLDSVDQAIRCALGMYLGEWFLDETIGVPWKEQVLVKNPSIPLITQIFRSTVAGVRGVASVPVCKLSLDNRTRKLGVKIDAKADLALLASTAVQPSDVGV